MAPVPFPVSWPNTRGTAAIAVAATPVFSISRLVESISVSSLLRDPFVEARGKSVGKIDSLLIRACYLVNGVNGASHAAGVAEGAQDLAGEVHLVDPAHAAHEHRLIGSIGEAERPGCSRQVPNGFPISLSVENLNTAVAAVGDINDVVIVDDNTVRGIEGARLVATPAPVLDEVSILIELRHARIAVSIGDKHAAVLAPGNVRLLIEGGLVGSGTLNYMRQPSPGLRVCSQRAHRASLGVEPENFVIGGIHVPEIALRIEADNMGAYEHCGAFTPGTHEGPIGLELQHRVIAAIERDDIARLGIDCHASRAAHDRVGGIVEEILDQMKWQLRNRCCCRASALRVVALALCIHQCDGAKRNRHGANR